LLSPSEHRGELLIKANDHGVDALRYGVKTTKGAWITRLRQAA